MFWHKPEKKNKTKPKKQNSINGETKCRLGLTEEVLKLTGDNQINKQKEKKYPIDTFCC